MTNHTKIKLANYSTIQLPSLYQQQIHLTKYSRWNDALGRRETWPETVYRYLDFMINYAATNFGYVIPEETQCELYEAILSLKVMPSMRAMMTAGKALEQDNAAAYNCFSGDTEILTEAGYTRLDQLSGHEVMILSPVSGTFERAIVRDYGVQQLNRVTFSNTPLYWKSDRGGTFTQDVTSQHRWILQDGSETTNLQVGDLIKASHASLESDPTGWIHGFIYGDGNKWRDAYETMPNYFNNSVDTSELFKKKFSVHLCGKKTQHLPRFFNLDLDIGTRVSYPPSLGGDPYVTVFSNHEMKMLPDASSDASYLRGFVEGLLAAAGSMTSEDGDYSASGDEATIMWIRDHLIYADYAPRGAPRESHAIDDDSNFGKCNQAVWLIGFRKCSDHRGFRVKDITPLNQATVYCAEEPKYGQLTLRNGARTGNCAYVPIDRLLSHDEGFYLSMCSVGVGFSVERQFIGQLPELPRELHHTETVVVVPDSRIGWSSAYRQFLNMLCAGFIPRWDVSKVRPMGARLVTFGGRASGPEPLEDLFKYAIAIFQEAIANGQRKLTSIQNHDLFTKMADVAVSGGVRRAATISLSNPSDTRMRDAKSGEWWTLKPHYRLANNSAVWTDVPSADIFLEEWLALVKSKSGERGIINRQALAAKAALSRRIDVAEWQDLYGVNPCFSGDTLIVTNQGAEPIENLINRTVCMFDGDNWVYVNNVRITGEYQPMIGITLQDGSYLRVTPYHKLVLEDDSEIEARQLCEGSSLKLSDIFYNGNISEPGAYLKGFLLGDGTVTGNNPPQAALYAYEPKWCCCDRLVESAQEIPVGERRSNAISELGWVNGGAANRVAMTGLDMRESLRDWCSFYKTNLPVEAFRWDHPSKCEFLAGLFDAYGTAMDSNHGYGYQLSSVSLPLLRDIQTLLKSIGVRSKIGLMHVAANRIMPGGVYYCQDCWRISIAQEASVIMAKQIKFTRLPSFADRVTTYNTKSRAGLVIHIEDAGIAEKVYCCTVPHTHRVALGIGIITGQCAEIILRPRQFCNLTTNIIRVYDKLRDLLKKIRLSTILGTLQSILTDFRYLSPEWRKNCEEERLLGVSLNGIMDNKFMSGLDYVRDGTYLTEDFLKDGVKVELPEVLAMMRDVAIEVNADWAKRLGINPSAAITTVKPEGNNSELVNCRSGLHGAHAAKRYIRTNRANKVDKLAQFMISQGVVAEDDVSSPQTAWVLSFPAEVPEGAITRNDYSAVEHLKIWKVYQDHWCEHKPSITVSVKDREWPSVGAFVYENWDTISGVSFLPYDGGNYRQAPYQTCSEAEHAQLVARTPQTIDWSKFNENDDYTTAAREFACFAGSCEVI